MSAAKTAAKTAAKAGAQRSAFLIGAHTIDTGGVHMAVRRAAAAGMDTLQLFTAIPKFYNDKTSVRPERIERFRAALDEAGIDGANVLVHAAYVLNTASSDEVKAERARAGLTRELERTTALGIGQLCFHPGSGGSTGDRGEAAARVGATIAHALGAIDGESRILVENTAGAGATLGRTPDEIGMILDAVPPALRARTGYGLDSCHLFASGHDIASSRESLTAVLDAFEAAAGAPPSFFHLNDSEGALGSNRDRHLLLGEGAIGAEPFRWLLEDPRARGVPLILETPQDVADIGEDDPSPDPADVRMVALLREFAS